MSAERQNVVLVYPVSDDGKRVLMQFHKNPLDPSYNRYNGLSAFPKPMEHLMETAGRALRGAGISNANLRFRGDVHWSRFDPSDWPLFGHHFLARVPSNPSLILEDEDVRRKWVDLDDLLAMQLPCWPGDAHIFPLLFDEDPRPFHGLMVYDQGVPQTWRVDRA